MVMAAILDLKVIKLKLFMGKPNDILKLFQL